VASASALEAPTSIPTLSAPGADMGNKGVAGASRCCGRKTHARQRTLLRSPSRSLIREVAEPELRPNARWLRGARVFFPNRGELRLVQFGRRFGAPPRTRATVLPARRRWHRAAAAAGSSALTDQPSGAEHAAVPSHRMAPLSDMSRSSAAASLPWRPDGIAHLRHGSPCSASALADHGAAGGVGQLLRWAAAARSGGASRRSSAIERRRCNWRASAPPRSSPRDLKTRWAVRPASLKAPAAPR